MNTNSPSDPLWEILHQAEALLTDGGFATPCPPPPQGNSHEAPAAGQGYDDLAAQYGASLAFGATWPTGTGPSRPQALILTQAPLSDQALAFMRTWFENPRVDLVVAQAFFVQALPVFAGQAPPYQALVRDLCELLRPKALLALGAVPAHRLLGARLSLETLRGSDYRFDRWTMVTTLDPEEFFSQDAEGQKTFKAQVWKDLQRLLGKLKYG